MRKKTTTTLFLTLSVLICGGADCINTLYGGGGSATQFSATLSGDREVPPVTTNGSGNGTFTLNGDETELMYDITVSGLSGPVIGAHFHFSASGPGENGPIVFNFTDQVTENNGQVTAQGTWPLSAADVNNLRLNYIYVNFHTDQNTAGEVRGDLAAVP